MKPLFVAEWAFAMGIITYRSIKAGRPPMPGMLVSVSGLFIALAVIADTGPGADRFAALFGAGLDIAAFMHLFDNPPAKGGQGQGKQVTGTTQQPGTTTIAGRG